MFSFCWIKTSHIGKSHILGKQVSLLAFRQVLTKILPVECIQLHNYDLFEKARLKLSPLIQNSVLQGYIPESYASYLLSYQKCQKIVAPTRSGLSTLPLNPAVKNLLIFPIRKIPLNRFKSFAIESFIYSPSNRNFQVITLCNLHLQLQSFLLHYMLNFRLYIHICHASFTNQCLLNVVFSMKKALNN